MHGARLQLLASSQQGFTGQQQVFVQACLSQYAAAHGQQLLGQCVGLRALAELLSALQAGQGRVVQAQPGLQLGKGEQGQRFDDGVVHQSGCLLAQFIGRLQLRDIALARVRLQAQAQLQGLGQQTVGGVVQAALQLLQQGRGAREIHLAHPLLGLQQLGSHGLGLGFIFAGRVRRYRQGDRS